ncbi:unnamed protein product [Rotaria sp. Silwood2]|nr:unnamed protein product [Rotaria sp. Silwood2]CAF3008072.1 unnamed protein product [Rotaria sp. Silwood2]CAF4031643.1 unnamed protein product [Rotaria sp. Silwood2]CAF4378982.1 unnamed protein product [Rotaria sp. Silwood2]CAF4442661.1 unnamed protein product [Rotaria sp. Silwood2]
MPTTYSNLSTSPVFFPPRYVERCGNASSDFCPTNHKQYQQCTDIENETIEDGENETNSNYSTVHIKHEKKYKKGDSYERHSYSIKCVNHNKDESKSLQYSREEKFLLPVTLAACVTVSSQHLHPRNTLCTARRGDFIGAYYQLELHNKVKTAADLVSAAAEGIIKEGTRLGKIHEAKSLSQQLLAFKHSGDGKCINYHKIPSEIGEICVNLYTQDSFWYKRINHVLRTVANITLEKVKTLGPFCYLLYYYLLNNSTTDILTVYRSLNLTDKERQKFMSDKVKLTSFISTSRSRKVAEFYDGNTLLIIDLNMQSDMFATKSCGANISSLSAFPVEEEFLIWPGTEFHFVKYVYHMAKKKHFIHLKALKKKSHSSISSV